MDFEFIREQTPLYIEAAKLTLHMAVIGVLLAIVGDCHDASRALSFAALMASIFIRQ